MKIALLNVKYSPNLGDGLLSECLEAALAAARPGIEVHSIDLAGRSRYSGGSGLRGPMLATIERFPPFLRARATHLALTLLVRLKLKRFYAEGLEGVDAVVLGGGNLIADSDLNFPVKIAAALGEAARRGLPVAVFGVGVSRNWSPTGAKLFRRAFGRSRLVDVTVRDARSQAVWDELLTPAGVRGAELARDPGLLAATRYAIAGAPADGPIGLCITDPVLLRYHAAAGAIAGDLGWWFRAVALALAARGRNVVLFTNGSPEDRHYLDAMAPILGASGGGTITRAPDFATPADLVRFIATCSLVIAHRMHACIAAHAIGIPTIGLAWDAKLDSFFALAGRSDFMVSPDAVAPDALVALADRARDDPFDTAAHATLVGEARADVARLAGILADAVAARR